MPNIVIIHTDTETVIAADSTPISYVTSVATVTDIDDTHISVTVGGVPIITMDINDITSIDGAAPYGNAGDIVGQITNAASGTPTLSQVLTAGASAGAKITNLTDPTSDQDAATKKYVDDNAGGASYLVYTALLTQSGTDAPVATVLQNTLGGTVVWTRVDVGEYNGTLADAFQSGKTFCLLTEDAGNGKFVGLLGRSSDNAVLMFQYSDPSTLGDDWTCFVEIRVYP